MTDKKCPEVDTSYWLTKDKAWMEDRKAQWPAIEKVVDLNRKKTEVNVIKQYFLKGKMPNWEKYQDWKDIYRHLDLRFFLWLHPSDDLDVLKHLYRSYVGSSLIHKYDVIKGYGAFLDNEFMRAPSSKKSLQDYPFPFMGKKNILVFRVLFEDIDYAKEKILNLVGSQENFENEAGHIFDFMGYDHFLRMRRWLMQDNSSPLNLNCLYQYEDALEWSLSTLTENRNQEFREGLETPEFVSAYQKALYCLYHFDTEKEGDTCRTRFVHKIRKILDEREFIPDFKQMWEGVKAGKVEVQDPWKR